MNPADLEVTMQTEEVYDPPADFRANVGVQRRGRLRAGRGRPQRLVGLLGREAQVERAVAPGARLERAVGQVVCRRQAERL